jgi:hypothetical protein
LTVYLAWSSAGPDDLAGPWSEARAVAPGLLLLESTESLSAVYHALKWSLPDRAALVVSAVDRPPKSRGLAPGTTSWLRARVPAQDSGR